jgi:adenylate kinase
MSREQAELLANSGHHPYRVIFLNAPIDTLKERLCLRRTDPVTGERYHLMYRIPPTQDVKNRLITHPNDEEKAVDKKVEQYNSYVEELQDYYTEALHINAEQDPYTVYEEIENFIIYPLPKAPLVKNTLLAP